jgi:hypothetical protein
MTNRERLISLLGFEPPKNSAEGALIDLGIVDTSEYAVGTLDSIKRAAIEVMKVLLTTADTTNGEVGFSVKYDRAAIEKRIAQLEDELNVTDARPTIKGIHPW